MRYTSESTMDDRALRDVERWKDKIEVRLDNRQVFFLFFGSALVACLLFILGVIVGKRLESRGKAAPPEVEDPLALLDKVASTPRTDPAPPVPKVLFGTPTPKAPAASMPAPPAAKAPVAVVPGTSAAKTPVTTSAAKTPVTTSAAKNPVTRGAVTAPKSVATVEGPAPAKPAATATRVEAPAPAPKSAPTSAPVAAPVKKVAVATPVPAADAAKAKGRFTLQLGSFPDKAEAEAFSQRFTGQGSYVIASEIPGKGTWFRVRVGDYGSAKDAIDAKAAFERQHNVIAYVVGPR